MNGAVGGLALASNVGARGASTAWDEPLAHRSPLFVAVEGATGVGKTTLVRRLAGRLDVRAVFDPFEANPFLSHLCAASTEQARQGLALATELTFLALRVDQLRQIRGSLDGGGVVVADWSMVKQQVFAASTLDPVDRARLARTCAVWVDDLPVPDLLVYLHATPATLAARVRGRGRPMECDLTQADLAALSAAFDEAIARYEHPVLSVDATAFDVFDDVAVDGLCHCIGRALTNGEGLC